MAVNESLFVKVTRMFNGGFAMGPKQSWRLQGAVLVAGMGVLALGILVASRQPQPVTTASAMEQEVEQPAERTAATRRARARQAENAVNTAVATSRANASAQSADTGIVSISGCLEQDDDVFRLKDTEGMNAPKARSWKSGFLKKGSTTVGVVDPSHELPLASQVGRRVRITGTLADRQMQVDAIHRVAAACKAN